MTTTQQKRLQERRTNVAWPWIVSTGVVGTFGCFLMSTMKPGKPLDPEFGLVLFCGVGFAALMIAFILARVTQDAKNNVVIATQGQIERQFRTFRGHKTYSVSVNQLSFEVSHSAYEAFVEGESYILYYVPFSQILISAEHIAS